MVMAEIEVLEAVENGDNTSSDINKTGLTKPCFLYRLFGLALWWRQMEKQARNG